MAATKSKSSSKTLSASAKSAFKIPPTIYLTLLVVVLLLSSSFYNLLQENQQARAQFNVAASN